MTIAMTNDELVLSCFLDGNSVRVRMNNELPDYILLKLVASVLDKLSQAKGEEIQDLLKIIGQVEKKYRSNCLIH